MNITDELRNLAVYLDSAAAGKSEHGFSPVALRLNRIADNIDAALDDYVALPKDADGETIHLQDRMSWDNGTFNVHELKLTADGWTTWDELHGYTVRADQCRHYHEPTVEDVLREFAQKMNENLGMYTGETIDADEWRDADAKTIAEYAAKLRLAGEE